MADELTDRQTVPLTGAERKRLRQAAAGLGTSPGLLARALLRSGLDALRRKDPAVLAAVEADLAAARKRWSAAGRKAATIRHARTREEEKHDGHA